MFVIVIEKLDYQKSKHWATPPTGSVRPALGYHLDEVCNTQMLSSNQPTLTPEHRQRYYCHFQSSDNNYKLICEVDLVTLIPNTGWQIQASLLTPGGLCSCTLSSYRLLN